ncbi:RNA 2'-phosphotransferase [Micromonospora sp. NBC_01638]|uniref:RNA 2'-phosphotransferase n=1 Tax=Micromonospora sp. NBC_01638 TaxID=2975982 RepID=UPI00386F7A21|nr:RNA 2'-phosphotransferase [Micromonospora sp. NBC_01638]
MEREHLVKLSKRMSKALRHDPDRAGLVLDPAGWTPVDALLAALRIERAELDAVVAGNDKQRFAVERGTDGVLRIRANQGHSVPVDLGLPPVTPPDRLYHGTSAGALESIRAAGLHRGGRHHVHLSADTETCAVPELFAQGVSWPFVAVEQDAVHGCSAAVPDRGSDVQLVAADDARRVRDGRRIVGAAP